MSEKGVNPDIKLRRVNVAEVPIADIEHQTRPLLRRPSWEQGHSVTNFGASSATCFQASLDFVAKLIAL
jgi:hypothetical protein